MLRESPPLSRAIAVLLAVSAALVGATEPARSAAPTDDRIVATRLPDSAAGQQLRWLIEASARLPISEDELRAHFAPELLAMPGSSPADTNATLAALFEPTGIALRRVVVSEGLALVALVTGRGDRKLNLTVAVDRHGLLTSTAITATEDAPPVSLPAPTGRFSVGSDLVRLTDPARGDRRLMLTRWYPATDAARKRPLGVYASRLLRAVTGLPRVRVHARAGARAVPGRLPTVLFSPGAGAPRVIYQALAEDLASHGYLVIAIDHTGEASVEFPRGRIVLPQLLTDPPADEPTRSDFVRMQRTRVLDLQLILRRLASMPEGPVADPTRIASMGHSLGGSSSAALMRVDPRIRAGIDLDGSIFGGAEKSGVRRPFLILGERDHDPTIEALLQHSTGPRMRLTVAGLQHASFSDMPVIAPSTLGIDRARGAADIAIQRAYVRAFLDHYVRGLPSPLLQGPSPRYPRVRFDFSRP